jgi:predicted AlkP superfamily pyrophosphatase or phosphodiesterase
MSSAPEVLPRYSDRGLGEIMPSAVAALGASGWDNTLDLPPASSYVVFLVDGLGLRLLERHAEEAPYLASLLDAELSTLTCGVPSTTATSLTSLGTGLPPGAHGVVGFTSRIPGTDQLLDALRWSSKVDPWAWQPHDTVYDRARQSGVLPSVVSKRMFDKSGLTVASQRGASYVGADSAGERISATVSAASESRSLTYVYESELDSTGHRRGCRSHAWSYQLAMIDTFAARLREALPRETVLVVTGDHGMVDVDLERRLDVDAEPDLMDGVEVFGGEARFRHLYCDPAAVGEVAARWRLRLGAEALVMTRDDAIEAGWFGVVQAQVRPRLGDVVVASMGQVAVVSSERFPHEAKLVGLHGSLTQEEMLVPLLVDAG